MRWTPPWAGGEMADTADLKSASPKGEWGFESPPAYQKYSAIPEVCWLTGVSQFSYLTATLTATSKNTKACLRRGMPFSSVSQYVGDKAHYDCRNSSLSLVASRCMLGRT